MLTSDEERYFRDQQSLHERKYLLGENPRQQSGFSRDETDWRRFRQAVVEPVSNSGTFLDIGCATGALMESVVCWAGEGGYRLEPYGLDISAKLAELARVRLPHWRDRIFVGNALFWDSPARFDFVRTELVYVPRTRRREYVERLLEHVVASDGRLIVCSYGSSRPEGLRAEILIDEIEGWGIPIEGVYDTVSQEHGFVITRVVSIERSQLL
jgi:hypothetical protein